MRALLHFVLAIGLMCTVTSPHASDLKTLEHELSDSVITTKITTKITESKHLNPLKISVSTDHGAVKLTGNVKNKEAFVEALRLVKATPGVESIDTDNLNIHDVNTSITDAYITAKVEAAVLKAKVLDDESIPLVGINANTNNGVVTLSGAVKNNDSIAPLIKRILTVHGVKKVVSHLHIAKTNS
ncbi:MAG: BON domain-containing protein [Legionella sp.]|jgi:hyperosmotically inducible protein|nr:BON domain-containing protein [Legionella sp.]